MAFKIEDRVRETTTTTGTGTINLGGAVTNFETFASNLSNSDTTYYAIVDNTNGAFEVGLGTFSTGSPNTLSRSAIASSNSNNLVNFGVATKEVFITVPASKMVVEDGSNNVAIGGTVTATAFSGSGASLTGVDVVNDTSPQLGGNLDVNGNDIVSTSGDANIEVAPHGTGGLVVKGNTTGSENQGKIILNCQNNSHGQTIKAQPHNLGVTNEMLLPKDGNSTLVSEISTQTLTNKTLTSPVIETVTGSTITLDSAGDITLDAGGADVTLKDDGTTFGSLTNSSGELVVKSGSTPTTAMTFSGANVTLAGNLTVNGTTTTVNSTTLTVDDPIITLGGDSAPGSDDNKDRGVEFRYHTGSAAKVGFFGFDDSGTAFTFIPDATNSSEVFSGSVGNVVFGVGTFGSLDVSGNVDVDGILEADAMTFSGANVTLAGNLTVNGTTTTVNSTTLTVDDPIITLGGDSAPGSDDNKDRGVEFRYHTGSAAKVGFFGFDDSGTAFTFIPDATNSSEVFSGSVGNVVFGVGTFGSLDVSGNVDVDGILEADAMTLNGTSITTTATLSTGISNGNVLVANANIVDNDFLRVDGTSIEGRSASELVTDIGAATTDDIIALSIALG